MLKKKKYAVSSRRVQVMSSFKPAVSLVRILPSPQIIQKTLIDTANRVTEEIKANNQKELLESNQKEIE